jgi:metallophosphoesterase superfamily enzyme
VNRENTLHFFVVGDWGRNGEEHQRNVAIMMSEAAKVVEPEFIISTGDNIYPNGVASVQDPLWMSSFENVYKEHNLFCIWNVVLGNHDYRGNVQAEIDYSGISRRWNMPFE